MEHTNLILRIAAIDPTFSGTPQEFVDHFVERAEILSPSGFFNVIIADVAPNSNEGLLLLGGTKIYVWSTKDSKYVPADITDSLYAPSIPDVLTGKWVLVSEGGVWFWKKASEFMTWLGVTGLSNIPLGPSGTILSSLATVDWRIPAQAIPNASVPVWKLQATVENVNQSPKVNPDGTVSWAAQPTLAASVKQTALQDIPTTLANVTVTFARPAGAVLLRVVLVKVSSEPASVNYPINDEIDVAYVDTVSENGILWSSFVVAESVTSWTLIRMFAGGLANLRVPQRPASTSTDYFVYIDPAHWKCKAIFF